MVPLIALLLFFFWWLPATLRMLPLPRTGGLKGCSRLGRRVVRGFITLTLTRPAQRRGWFFGCCVFSFALSLLLTLLVNLFSFEGAWRLLAVLWFFALGSWLLLKYFPHRFDNRALYPLPGRRRRGKRRSQKR